MNLLRIYLTDKGTLGLEISPWVAVPLTVLLLVLIGIRLYQERQRLVDVTLDIKLGGVGTLTMKPNWGDVQIAHKIWTELVTRKAAIQVDPSEDVIVEIYDSWYALFQRVRQLVGEIPPQSIRRQRSTQQLVRIATQTLNRGLRPHLTRWQARYRNWWQQTESELKTRTPQQHQRDFPEYAALIAEMQAVNAQLIQYASELQKIVLGAEKAR